MNFPDLPDWVAWLAQDGDGACARKGQAVAVKPSPICWYENEVSRIVRLGKRVR